MHQLQQVRTAVDAAMASVASVSSVPESPHRSPPPARPAAVGGATKAGSAAAARCGHAEVAHQADASVVDGHELIDMGGGDLLVDPPPGMAAVACMGTAAPLLDAPVDCDAA
eukprot:2262445-Prymnesium_polylepis.1